MVIACEKLKVQINLQNTEIKELKTEVAELKQSQRAT
jgi:hypothetical protein